MQNTLDADMPGFLDQQEDKKKDEPENEGFEEEVTPMVKPKTMEKGVRELTVNKNFVNRKSIRLLKSSESQRLPMNSKQRV